MTIEKLNRQTRLLYGPRNAWINQGNVTFETAAIEAAKGAGVYPLTIEVRCESNPDDVREFTVRRKFEYIVEGLRGGM